MRILPQSRALFGSGDPENGTPPAEAVPDRQIGPFVASKLPRLGTFGAGRLLSLHFYIILHFASLSSNKIWRYK